jgi:KDO2-lipid IV(A) lauroyltransferase
VTVEYFGRPASTSSAIASLALRTGAAIIPMFALPLDDGRYRIMCEPVVELPPAGSPDAVRQITQQCTSVLEMYVRRYPHLWLWMHRRWRQPDGAPGRAIEPEMFPAEAPDTPELAPEPESEKEAAES